MSGRISSSTGINPCISSWTSLTSRPSFGFPYFFHFSPIDWLFFSIFSLGGKRSSLGDHQLCTSTFDWTLPPGFCVKKSKAQALCWAHHCLHSFIKTSWCHKASEGSGMVLVCCSLTVILLIHLLMETLYLQNLYCLKKSSKAFSELYIFMFHSNCTGIFLWILWRICFSFLFCNSRNSSSCAFVCFYVTSHDEGYCGDN